MDENEDGRPRGRVSRIEIVADQDTDRDGNPTDLVMILQGYSVKASVRP